MFQKFKTKNSHRNITAALKRLNVQYPANWLNKSLEECVTLRIIEHGLSKGLLYKIDEDLPQEIKEAIKDTITDEAKKSRMEIITM